MTLYDLEETLMDSGRIWRAIHPAFPMGRNPGTPYPTPSFLPPRN